MEIKEEKTNKSIDQSKRLKTLIDNNDLKGIWETIKPKFTTGDMTTQLEMIKLVNETKTATYASFYDPEKRIICAELMKASNTDLVRVLSRNIFTDPLTVLCMFKPIQLSKFDLIINSNDTLMNIMNCILSCKSSLKLMCYTTCSPKNIWFIVLKPFNTNMICLALHDTTFVEFQLIQLLIHRKMFSISMKMHSVYQNMVYCSFNYDDEFTEFCDKRILLISFIKSIIIGCMNRNYTCERVYYVFSKIREAFDSVLRNCVTPVDGTLIQFIEFLLDKTDYYIKDSFSNFIEGNSDSFETCYTDLLYSIDNLIVYS